MTGSPRPSSAKPTAVAPVTAGAARPRTLGVQAPRWAARWTAGGEARRAEMKGLAGVLNIEFTGDDGGAVWHVSFDDGRVVMRKGAGENPRATVRLQPRDYLAMVAGDLAYSTARMTGRIRLSGDGHFGIVFGASVENLRAAQRAPGPSGWIARRLIGRA